MVVKVVMKVVIGGVIKIDSSIVVMVILERILIISDPRLFEFV
jgi:hypothetical protein